jgi:hypothetical protein
MREGLLSESSDYGSRPLRDQLKRTWHIAIILPCPSTARRGGGESRSSVLTCSRECKQGAQIEDDSWSIRAIQILLQPSGVADRVR